MMSAQRMVQLVGTAARTRVSRIRSSLDPIAEARRLGVTVGEGCRLIGVEFGSEPYLVTLGDRVSATRTSFITHDGAVWILRDEFPLGDRIAPIFVGDNVFFGLGVIVLPGVTIGNNVIVGAGAVVTKDISDDSVVVGSPARQVTTVSEYTDRVSSQLLSTKHMDPKSKREFLLRRFGLEG